MITIVDYGVGNLGSIRNMLKKIGVDSRFATSSGDIDSATKLILPGVGAFDAGMQNLIDSGMVPSLEEAVVRQCVPVLGICLGMQLMTKSSEEGKLSGLGWIDACTVKFRPTIGEALRIPHMGWNVVIPAKDDVLINGFSSEERFYFVHSYHVCCKNEEDVLLKAQYGSLFFHASFSRGNIYGCQFHPEKSHKFGMNFIRNFVSNV